MKKTFLIALVVAFGTFMLSCSKDTMNPNTDPATDDVSEIAATMSRFAAATSDSTTTKQCKGKLTPVDAASLPTTITAYITANYAGSTVKMAGKDTAGNYVVGVQKADGTQVGLVFNADGSFKEALTKKYGERAKLTDVAVASLPVAVTSYISSNYAGATIKHAGKNTDGLLFVAIAVGTDYKLLVFNADGTFKEALTPPPGMGKVGHGPKKH